MGLDTYVEVLEGVVGRQGLAVAPVGSRTLIAEAPGNFFSYLKNFYFLVLFCFAVVVLFF